MKKQWLVALILVMAVLFTACGQAAAPAEGSSSALPQELDVSIAVELDDLNPLTTSTVDTHEVLAGILDPLIRQQANGLLEQGSGLAESWEISDDGLVYTFHLRDAKFSTGDPIRAQDFVYTWKKVLDPNTASEYAFLMYPIVGGYEYNTGAGSPDDVAVVALDDKTLQVTLTDPTPYFLSVLGMSEFCPMPEGIVEEFGDDFFMDPEHMVFSGPFKMTEWVYNQYIVLEKNPDYWDAENVKLEKLTYHMTMETNTIVNMFDSDQIDVMQVQPEFLDTYREYKNFVPVTEAVTEYLKFNFKNEFFANKNIREAFSMAIDRTSYMNDYFKTGSTPAYGYVPPSIYGKDNGDFREQNGELYTDTNHGNTAEEAAAKLDAGLAEIGKTREDLSAGLSLVIGQGDLNLKTAQVLQEMWKNTLGVDLEVKSLAYAMRQEEYDSEEYFIGKEGWGADYNDPMTFLDLFETTSSYNDLGYSNPEFDACIEAARTTQGNERMEKLLEAERILLEDCAIAPTFFQTRTWVYKDHVQGVVRNGCALRCDYKWAYVE